MCIDCHLGYHGKDGGSDIAELSFRTSCYVPQ